jgi:DNA-directed RNA polymerase specialized sigma subunit
MGHKTMELILKSKLKYAVLNKETQLITLYYLQKDISDLLGVSRRTIYRGDNLENSKYKVYLVTKVP